MQGYNFTERVRRVLAAAREAATDRHHETVNTEHLLLGLIRVNDGVAAAALRDLGVDRETLRMRVDDMAKPQPPRRDERPDLPYSSRGKKVLELAMHEARFLDHSYVGTEHLLLGLLREEKGVAAQVLTEAGLTLERVREEVGRILGDESGRRASGGIVAIGGPVPRLELVRVELVSDEQRRYAQEFATVAEAIRFLQTVERGQTRS